MIKQIVQSALSGESKCFSHCDKHAKLYLSEHEGKLLGVYACPSGYVSRIVLYERTLELEWFKRFLESVTKSEVKDSDIRIATRHPWELALDVEEKVVLKEAYWTQNYRRTKSEDPNRIALFRCTTCGKLFLQSLSSSNTLCETCSKRA
jgi:hypothetical protein